MKTLSPRKIAFRAGLFSAIVAAVLVVVLSFLSFNFEISLWLMAVFPIIIFFASSGIFYYLMERYIDQKIRLIYKSIHQEKIGRPLANLKIDMSKDVFREVNKDVENWAQDYRKEISNLKEQAEFRREFIGNLSHELKTPITIIQGNILTLLEGAVDDKSIRNKFLQKAANNVERLEDLTRDLDRITNLEGGKDYLNITKFNLVDLVYHVADNLQDKAKDKKVNLKIRNPKTKEINVSADKSKIDQVLTNLIVNSINYGKQGGTTSIDITIQSPLIHVEVIDDGIAIESKHLPRLFERFFRVDKSRSRHIGGTGLGLAIVKHILDAHHQTVSVTSEIDKGSIFTFTLEKDY
jgi:two-component system phosphate regulon sensor histidine kinase PhoR